MSPQQARKLLTLMVEQGTLRQHTVRTAQCTVVPSIFGSSEPAKDEVGLHSVQDCCVTISRCYVQDALWRLHAPAFAV